MTDKLNLVAYLIISNVYNIGCGLDWISNICNIFQTVTKLSLMI